MKAKSLVMIGLCVMLIVGSSISCVDSVADAIKYAIDELARQPDRWQSVLETLIEKTGGEMRTTIVTLKKEMEDLTRLVIEDVGIEGRCNAKFIGEQVQSALEQLLSRLDSKHPRYELAPWVCHLRPEQFTIDQYGVAPSLNIEAIGFGFTQENVHSAEVFVVDEHNTVLYQVNTTGVFHTASKMGLNIQGMQFPLVYRNRLRLRWPVDGSIAETSIMLSPTPTPAPLLYDMPPRWTNCTWKSVGRDKSYDQNLDKWCDNGGFLVQLDLDGGSRNFAVASVYPIVGQARCCQLAGLKAAAAGTCTWELVGYSKSHEPDRGDWCPQGSFLTQLQLQRGDPEDGDNFPIVARARCCALEGTQSSKWGSVYWTQIGYDRSHVADVTEPWCLDGSFLTQLDLDGGHGDQGNYPIVSGAKCASPQP